MDQVGLSKKAIKEFQRQDRLAALKDECFKAAQLGKISFYDLAHIMMAENKSDLKKLLKKIKYGK